VRGAVDRVSFDPARLDDVILGCTNQAGEDNRNVARMAALLAGFPSRSAGTDGQSPLRLGTAGDCKRCTGDQGLAKVMRSSPAASRT
jgi:hypothetical protein